MIDIYGCTIFEFAESPKLNLELMTEKFPEKYNKNSLNEEYQENNNKMNQKEIPLNLEIMPEEYPEEKNEVNIEEIQNSRIKILLKDIKDYKTLTKEFLIDKSTKVRDFIESNFNHSIIMIHKGSIIDKKKTFEENNFNSPKNQHLIFYFEKDIKNIS